MKLWIILLFLIANLFEATAQKKTPEYDISSTFVAGTGNSTAFWGVSNKFGLISPLPYSAMLRGKFYTSPDTSKNKIWDYAYGIDLANRVDSKYSLLFHQYYLKLKYRFITLQGGRLEEYFGNQDSTLSSGGLLWSTNAPPMPKITFGILNYVPVPFTRGYLEVKGAISHGWFEKDAYVKHLWLHHKYIYVQAGGNLPVKVHFGFHHFVQWGGTLPNGFKLPSSFHDFMTIFFAHQYDSAQFPVGTPIPGEYSNRIGNHLGSRNFGLDLNLKPASVSFYYQTIFEDFSGLRWLNKRDGLWGIAIKPKKIPWLSKIVYEFVNTTDQSMTFGGDKYRHESDNYFNHGIYLNGWTYDNFTIGTPLITSPVLQKYLGLPDDIQQADYLRNNKVIAHHIGLQGSILETNYKMLVTYTKNSGTYYFPFDESKKSVSTYLELKKQIKRLSNIEVSFAIASDFGRMYTNKSSFLLTLRKNGKLF